MQAAVAVGGLVPVTAGVGGILLGPGLAGSEAVTVLGDDSLDSHFRYLSGLLLGIGLCFWGLIPRIAVSGRTFRLLTGIVVVGGLGRLWSLADAGLPGLPMLFALVMELGVTPALCLWQAQVEAAQTRKGSGP